MKRAFYKRLVTSSLLMLLALSATAGLGIWQYTVAHRNDVIALTGSAPAKSFNSVSQLGTYVLESNYGQAVQIAGVLNCSEPLTVVFDQSRPAWEVCPLELVDGNLVALAFQSAPVAVDLNVTIQGRIQPAHSVDPLPVRYEKTASVEQLNTDELALRWQNNVRDGYLVVTEMQPAASAEFLSADLIVWPPVGIQLRNLFYAWQWWIFAIFSVFIWAKYVIDEYRGFSKSKLGDVNESAS